MIENYPNERKLHCETGVMSNMMQYYAYDISEQMVFGIGSGMYFLYFPWLRLKDSVLIVMRTRPTDVIRHFVKRMNIGYHEMTFGNNSLKAEKALDELVAKNIPTGLTVNILGLKYLTDLGLDLDYNGHHITVIGKEGTQYIVADVDGHLPTNDLFKVDETVLRQIRFRPGISAPHGRMFYIDPLPADFAEKTDLKRAVIGGLKESCKNMISIPLPYFGYKGIHYFANDLRKWKGKYTEDKIDFILHHYYKLIEHAGTGGAGYRYIYADFLKEATSLFQSQVLDDCSAIMTQAADTWRVFTTDCNRYINKTGITLNELADIVDEAGNYEYKTFKKLKGDFLKKTKQP